MTTNELVSNQNSDIGKQKLFSKQDLSQKDFFTEQRTETNLKLMFLHKSVVNIISCVNIVS